MSQSAHRPATYDDLLALPENVVGEIVDGELVVSPRSAGPHTLATSSLGVELGGPFQRGRGGSGGGGVNHLWIVDPIARTLEVMRNESGRWILVGVYGEADKVRAEPFDAVELELGALWGIG